VAWRQEVDQSKLRTFFSYGRVSTTKQRDNGGSLDAQESAFIRLIEEGYKRIGIYQDAKSAHTIAKRLGFKRMLHDLRTRRPDFVAFWDVSRFSRNLLNTLIMYDELHKLGVIIYVCEEREFKDMGDDVTWSEMVDQAKYAEKERRKIASYVQSTYDRKRDRGDKIIMNRPPFGVAKGRNGAGQAIPIPDEVPLGTDMMSPAALVSEADRKFLGGRESALAVSLWLNDMTMNGRRKQSSINCYGKLANNELLMRAGVRTPQQWEQIKARFRSTQGFKNRSIPHVMTQVVQCPYCADFGEAQLLVAGMSSGRGDKRVPNLFCPRSECRGQQALCRGNAHPNFIVAEHLVEQRFIQLIGNVLATENFVERYDATRAREPVQKSLREHRREIAEFQQQIVEQRKFRTGTVKIQIAKPDLADAYDEVIEEATQRISLLEQEIVHLEAKIAKLTEAPEAVDGKALWEKTLEVHAIWTHAKTPPDRKAVIARELCAAVGSHPIIRRLNTSRRGDYALMWDSFLFGIAAFPTADELPFSARLAVRASAIQPLAARARRGAKGRRGRIDEHNASICASAYSIVPRVGASPGSYTPQWSAPGESGTVAPS
jgi:DNA invertase Pin-like site-specific DNA recombinase